MWQRRIYVQITAETKKVSELLPIAVGSVAYVIPSYQRPFSWKSEQIEQLFNDIKDEEPGYYAGNILVTGEGSLLSVIDGQQRLTTISLFLLSIGMKLKSEYPVDEMAFRLRYDIERQLYFDSQGNYEEPRIKLLAGDRELYENLLGMLKGREPGRYGNRVFFKRYKYIVELVDSSFTTFQEINSFYQKLMQLELLKVSVPELGDAFNVFSSLNSKGLPLTLIDLLKGEFINVASKSGESTELTLEKWNELSTVLSGGDEDASNRIVTQFLLNNYDAFEDKGFSSITKTKALSRYQRLLPRKYEAGENYLSTLLERAKVFAEIAQLGGSDQQSGGFDSKFAALVRLESTQSFPLLMYVMCARERLRLSDGDVFDILDFLISFYVRRNIVLTPKSSNIRARMLSVIRELDAGESLGPDAVNVITTALAEISASDDQFRAALDQPIYDKNKKTARYVLIDIERRVGGAPLFDKGRPDSLDSYEPVKGGRTGRPIWTIEHILPEGDLPDWWIDELGEGDAARSRDVQERCTHLFGNLTLTPYNSELAQKPFFSETDPDYGSKRDYRDRRTGAYVGLRSGLFLNSSIANEGAGEMLETKERWMEEDIARRNAWFSDLILSLYRLS